MRVLRIALTGFRNYEWESFEFSPGTNVIRGKNGQGKTNLLEAVFMLTGGRSFRTRFDKEIVGFGYSSAEILAEVEAAGREQTVKISLAPGQRKLITVNSVKKTASELAGTMTAVLFCPDELTLVREGAAVRRRLMDSGHKPAPAGLRRRALGLQPHVRAKEPPYCAAGARNPASSTRWTTFPSGSAA